MEGFTRAAVAAPRPKKVAKEAERKLKAGDLDGALADLEEVASNLRALQTPEVCDDPAVGH